MFGLNDSACRVGPGARNGLAARMMIKHVHSPGNLPKLSEKIFYQVDSRWGLGGCTPLIPRMGRAPRSYSLDMGPEVAPGGFE
jgi:hypothetical protein